MTRLKIKDDRDYVAQVGSSTVKRWPKVSTPLPNDVPVGSKLDTIEEKTTSPTTDTIYPAEEISILSSDATVDKSTELKKQTKKKKNEEAVLVGSTEEVEPTKPGAKTNKRSTKKKRSEAVVVAPRRSGRSRKEPERYTA